MMYRIVRLSRYAGVYGSVLWLLFCCCGKNDIAAAHYNVKDYNAIGDGQALDTKAINAAIEACATAGGGTVFFPAGTYLSGSIRLKSNVALTISEGATIMGAPNDFHAYDPPEENPYDMYQDFGHSHWHNSLIWGEGLENITIQGLGTINGGGISRHDVPAGDGDKAIALKLCKNIIIKDVTIKQGGHFAILASGCENITIDNIKIYTGRDGINLDCFTRNAKITNSYIQAVGYLGADGDDGIALKSSYALGYASISENITVDNCTIWSGCNALQFGSETAGDFRNVHFSNITILGSEKAGIGITSNDGSVIDSVTFCDITMSKVATPIFIKIGARGRAPDNPPVGKIRNVILSNITADDVYGYLKDRKWTSTIAGTPGHPVENIVMNNITITYKGGGEKEWADIDPPETDESAPRKFGIRPSYGFYCRHVKGLEFHNVKVGFEEDDLRPVLIFDDADGIELDRVTAERAVGSDATVVLKQVHDFNMHDCSGLPDVRSEYVEESSY